MNARSLKLLLIPLFLAFIYFILVSYPYFFSKITRFSSLGFFSVVEEKSADFKLVPSSNRTTDQFDNHILVLAGEKVVSQFRATENNLGIVLIRFERFGKVSDKVSFRLKQEGTKDWYYQYTYRADQFQDNEYFTFGFPPIAGSQSKSYIFEVESHAGKYNNGVGVSLHESNFALVYKYSRDDLKNYNTLFSFVYKKFVYTLTNVNLLENWRIMAAFVLALLFVIFATKKKITVTGVVKFLQSFKKKYRRISKVIINGVKSNYISLEKKIIRLSTKVASKFSPTKFHLPFLNTNIKKRLAIGLLIFLLALTYRFTTSLVNQSSLFYAGLGGQGDYDQFIRAATCAVRNFCPAILGQNFLIESSILGLFYEIFGFVGGLKAYLYLMIILSSIVATLPYILLSRKHFLTIGGIIGGLFLATSDFLTYVALNFPPDNGSLFVFSMFFIVYLFTINIGTIRWLLLFGLAGFIDGMNKALFLINDLVALALFVPVFFYEKVSTKGRKTLSLFQKKNMRILLLSAVPVLVFVTLYSAWEYFVYIKFSVPYFLRELILSRGENFIQYTSLNDKSLTGNFVFQLFFICASTIVMLKRLIEHTGLETIFLAPIYVGLLFVTFVKKKLPLKKFILAIVFSVALIVQLTLIKNNYLGIHGILGDYIYAWSYNTFINVFLFVGIIFFFILNFKYSAIKLFLPIAPYVVMLIILTKNSPFARLHTHVVVWTIIFLVYIIDLLIANINKRLIARARVITMFIILVLFISVYLFPKMVTMITQLNSDIVASQNEARYLKWVEKSVPANAIVLAGGKSDLVAVAQNIKKPIIYNSSWIHALFIRPKEIPGIKAADFNILLTLKIKEIPGVTPSNFSITSELKNKENFKKNKYLILEDDIYLWRGRMAGVGDNLFSTSSAALLNGENYSIKVYKSNSLMNRGIYELKLKETENL